MTERNANNQPMLDPAKVNLAASQGRMTYKLTVQSRGMIVDALRCAAIAMDALGRDDPVAEAKATQLAELAVVMFTAREIVQGTIED